MQSESKEYPDFENSAYPEYTREDIELFVNDYSPEHRNMSRGPIEKYRKAWKEGKKPIECLWAYVRNKDYPMKDRFYDGFEEVLTAPLEDVPLFVNDDRALDGISVKNLVAWRLKIGR